MTTIKQYLKNIASVSDEALSMYSVLVRHNTPCGELMVSETEFFLGNSTYEILGSDEIRLIFPRFHG